MAVTAKMFTNAAKPLLMGAVTWKTTGGSAIKCALLTSAWVLNQDTNIFLSDISVNEVANGNGYVTGGAAMVPTDPTVDVASNEVRCDAGNVVWSASTITARYAVIYFASGTAATSNLIAYVDFGADVVSVAGTFTITWSATGVFKITAA